LRRRRHGCQTLHSGQAPCGIPRTRRVACQSNPVEIEALKRCCSRGVQVDAARWTGLSQLRIGQAVALPVTEEAGGAMRPVTLGPRLTPHVRHREKYVDTPVTEDRAFVFGTNGHGPARRARTLRQFVVTLEGLPPRAADAYLRRGDFSRWIQHVFGDGALASELRTRSPPSRRRTPRHRGGGRRGRSKPLRCGRRGARTGFLSPPDANCVKRQASRTRKKTHDREIVRTCLARTRMRARVSSCGSARIRRDSTRDD
jgi:hypothetical protein